MPPVPPSSLLYRLLSGTSNFTLNGQAPRNESPVSSADLTQLMARFKEAAITAEGHQVDYLALAKDLETVRQDFYAGLRSLDPDSLTRRDQGLAFWINLYNILVLDAVLAFQVTKSVIGITRGLLRFFEKAAYQVGDHRFSANDIENGILRLNRGHFLSRKTQFPDDDPRLAWVLRPMDVRIHFALHCASRSCPPIRVYEESQLPAQLDLATRAFVDTETQTDPASNILEVSTIFDWYKVDFTDVGSAAGFVLRYLDEADPRHKWLQSHLTQVKIRYRKYDWGLNSASTVPS